MAMDIHDMMRLMVEKNASDLVLKVGLPPVVRIHGDLINLDAEPTLTDETMSLLADKLTKEEDKVHFIEKKELDFGYTLEGVGRFRVNIFQQRGHMGAVLRTIPLKVITMEELGLPDVLRDLVLKPRGLVLVTGPTGSGKSTSLAAMIDFVNRTERKHIITVEDPLEFIHTDKKSIIEHRELGADTLSFANALRGAMRQNPDIILVGEMRDLETIQLAITAAETGHMVFATLHTSSAATTVDRMIDVFPAYQQEQIRTQLAATLEGVISQTLIPLAEGHGRFAALEIMVCTYAIRNLIREKKSHQIPSMIQQGAKEGMLLLDMVLRDAVKAGKIKLEDAMAKAANPEELKSQVGRVGAGSRMM